MMLPADIYKTQSSEELGEIWFGSHSNSCPALELI